MSVDREKLRERLLETFATELDEHARTIETSALALEKIGADAPPGELVMTLFRAAHSLKGAARSVGVPLIEAACHLLEEMLSGAREGQSPPSATLVPLLLSTADALADAARRLRAKEDVAAGPLAAIVSRLEAARHTRAIGPAAPPSPPAPPVATPAPAPAPGPAPAPPPATLAQGIVRLPAAKLDVLVSQSGELLVARRRAARWENDVASARDALSQCLGDWRRLERSLRDVVSSPAPAPAKPRSLPKRAGVALARTTERLESLERRLDAVAHGLALDHHVLAQAAAPLEEHVRRVRMLPFSEACEGLERAVRDLAHAGNKQIALTIEGGDVEIDRAILADLRDPLLHLVRNAVDHGIERPADRVARGKPAEGRITIGAALKGAAVEVSVADDGRGLDLDAIRAHARRRDLPISADDRELSQLVFTPGFSTAKFITELSGRGVGLDVVKHRIESLHGNVDVAFEPGRGTRFHLSLPLTLTTLRALLVRIAGQTFALPTTYVKRLVRAGSAQIGSIEGREMLLGGAAPVPIAALADTLGLDSVGPEPVAGKLTLVVVTAGTREIAFAVDELLAEQDVVIKSLGRRLRHVRHFSGATVLPTGQLTLILAASELVDTASRRAPARSVSARLEEKAPLAKKRLIIADDSVTTRSLEKSILEGAGYEVQTAADGAAAWALLQERGADLVVTDVEMPRMNGFELTQAIRASKRFRHLPVILVTGLETDEDRARGLELGADAYLPKSSFDQKQLLDAIAMLL